MQYTKKDEDQQVASALRSMGMQIDGVAMELILAVSDLVRKNRDSKKETSLLEILNLKKEVEDAVAPKPMGMPMPGQPPMQKLPN